MNWRQMGICHEARVGLSLVALLTIAEMRRPIVIAHW